MTGKRDLFFPPKGLIHPLSSILPWLRRCPRDVLTGGKSGYWKNYVNFISSEKKKVRVIHTCKYLNWPTSQKSMPNNRSDDLSVSFMIIFTKEYFIETITIYLKFVNRCNRWRVILLAPDQMLFFVRHKILIWMRNELNYASRLFLNISLIEKVTSKLSWTFGNETNSIKKAARLCGSKIWWTVKM